MWTSDGVHLNWHLFNNPPSVLQERSAHCWAEDLYRYCDNSVCRVGNGSFIFWGMITRASGSWLSQRALLFCAKPCLLGYFSPMCIERALFVARGTLVSQCSCSWDASGTINTLCECCCSVPGALPGQALCDTESESKAPNCPEEWVHVGTPTGTAPLVCICLKFCSAAAVPSR